MSLPVVSGGVGMPLFTVEQIELIRRLRNSGVTKEQVIQAYDSLNRIDSELGNLYTIPLSLASMVVKTTPPASQINPRPVQQLPTLQTIQPVVNKQIKKTVLNVCQTVKASSSTEVTGVKRARRSSVDDDQRVDETDTGYLDEMDTQSPGVHGVDDDLKARLEDFMRLPSHRRLEKIINMVSVAGVRVPDIAAKTGLSNTTINRFLHGETVDISSNQKRSIYLWYLRQVQKTEGMFLTSTSPVPVVRSPSSLGVRQNTVMQVQPHIDHSRPDTKPDLADAQERGFEYPCRRERFIFREKHLEILDEAFRTNQYPSAEEREEIARRCNETMIAVLGKELSERQTVTCFVVSNWFNNRRKDIKRIAREEGIACSQVVLPSRTKQKAQAQSSSMEPESSYSMADENTSNSTTESDTNQLDPATINKLLYDVTEKNITVKLESPDDHSY